MGVEVWQERLRPVFIVGTGRCGSTALSNILNQHPSVLSLSEFFISLLPNAFVRHQMTGSQFWELLSTSRPKATLMLKHGIDIPEFLYRSKNGVSPILLMTLPHLTDEPEYLHNEIRDFVVRLSEDSLAHHYIRLFEWLKKRLNKMIWVERSGGSLQLIASLISFFPDAKFVHLTRDGRDCALSMSKHHTFRLAIIQNMIKQKTGIDPYYDQYDAESLYEKLGPLSTFLPESFDVEAYKRFNIPLEQFGAYWTSQIMYGVPYLKKLPEKQFLWMKYEDLIERPDEELLKLMQFILPDMDHGPFISQVKTQIKKTETQKWKNLDVESQEKLYRSCQLGLRILKYI